MKTSITFEIDTDGLADFSDEHIAELWHIAQANPAPFGNRDAGDMVRDIGNEIIKRWMKAAPVTMYKHQASHHYLATLQTHGKWVEPDYQTWVPHPVAEGGAT